MFYSLPMIISNVVLPDACPGATADAGYSRAPRSACTWLGLFLLVVMCTSLPCSVSAAGRWYQVEVIVFRYANPSSAELAVPPERLPNYSNSISLVTDLPSFDDEPASRPNEVSIPGPTAFQSLGRGELELTGVYRRLRNVETYVPVLHVGWRQPGLSDSRARRVYISDRPRSIGEPAAVDDFANPAPQREQRIEGTVRVRTGLGLQVDADFLDYGGEVPVRIHERRKVKFRELHYFDSPFFGVLIRIVPYRIAEAGQDSADSEGDTAE